MILFDFHNIIINIMIILSWNIKGLYESWLSKLIRNEND